MGRTIGWVLAVLLLAVTGVLGIHNVIDEWAGAETAWQRSVTAGGGVYGVLGLVAAWGLARRRRWSVGAATAWAAAVTYTGTMAVVAYGGEGIRGAIPAFLSCVLIGALVVWAARVATRGAMAPGAAPLASSPARDSSESHW